MFWEDVSYEIIDYESELLQVKICTIPHFPWMAGNQFSKKNIYVTKVTLLTFDFFFSIGTNILRIVFDFIIDSIVTYFFLFFLRNH